MENRDEIIKQIKENNESLKELCYSLIRQNSKAVFANIKMSIFLYTLGYDILTFSTLLSKSLKNNQLSQSYYNNIKEKIKDYLDEKTVLANAEPRLNRDLSTVLYDYTIFVIRSFFRVFDLLFTLLSCSEKTMAQRADDKIQDKYTFLDSDNENLIEIMQMMRTTCFFNYSKQLQFFQLDSQAYKKEISNFHNKLSDKVKAIDELVGQLLSTTTPKLT